MFRAEQRSPVVALASGRGAGDSAGGAPTHKFGMMFDGNIIPISLLGGRVIDAKNRSPLFRITR
ncbi:MAG: hypothetical protein B7Z04_14775 [Rhodobacterales bacterium 32-66-9]|nr:MAG: hypothetical protein B7Z04_14775 [Rhodobacterales bacterium 32-66-9]